MDGKCLKMDQKWVKRGSDMDQTPVTKWMKHVSINKRYQWVNVGEHDIS